MGRHWYVLVGKAKTGQTLANYVELPNGPGCPAGQTIDTAAECEQAAVALGRKAKVTQGKWGHAPFGCFIGHPNDGWKNTFFNRQAGQTGRDVYRSICKGMSNVYSAMQNVRLF